jgi:hypothetical protein
MPKEGKNICMCQISVLTYGNEIWNLDEKTRGYAEGMERAVPLLL